MSSETPSVSPTEGDAQFTSLPSQQPTANTTYPNMIESIEAPKNKTSSKNGSVKVNISGDLASSRNKDHDVSIDKNGKVSFSGSTDEDKADATAKVSIAGVLSNKKYDNENISISKRGKVSFSGIKEVTPEPSPAPIESKSSVKISMKGVLPPRNNNNSPSVSIGRNGKVLFGHNGSVGNRDTTPFPSYVPTSYLPTTDYSVGDRQPSPSGGKGKVSLTFPTSRGQNNEVNIISSPTNPHGFKSISYYTDAPTSGSTSLAPLAPSPPPEQATPKNKKDKNKKTPSPTIRQSNEPTYFAYPTYYPTLTETKLTRNDQASNYPTYWPTYVPTQATNQRSSSFGFGSASGRDNNLGHIDFLTPGNDALNETLGDETNATMSKNETIVDFMTTVPVNITSDETPTSESLEDETQDPTDIYQKRICPGFPLGTEPSAPKVEQEVFFTYGIEVSTAGDSSVADSVGELQRLILDDVAMTMLRCDERRRLWWSKREKPIARVYYTKSAEISTLSKFINRF
jgi:hypothetical protein